MTTQISKLIERARSAQQHYDSYNQSQVDEVVTAAAWGIVNPKNNRLLAEMAVADTGLGNVEDKITKNRRKTMGLLRDLRTAKSVGVVAEYPEKGLVEIARAVGVVGAIVPSTNPAATPANKTLNALKGRNAIVLAPSPKGDHTCAALVDIMRAELERVGAPVDLIQKLPSPINKADTEELMQSVDLIVATGSQNNVRNAYSSGTPAVGVGAGNVVSIVDETADLAAAAQKIVTSKSFDNATSCSSENNLIIVKQCYEAMMTALADNGAIRLSKDNKVILQKAMWPEGKLNQAIIARTAGEIIGRAELSVAASDTERARILLVEESNYGPDAPFSGEKLSPILTVYQADDFDHAQELANGIMDYQGKGHSVSIHTNDAQRPLKMGLEMPVCRVIVNQIHCYATGGNFDNGLPFSLSMGCGSWGENSISDNMNYRHYLNTTRVVRTIPTSEPSEQDIFGDYWQKYSCGS
ncbi:MAG: acylating sulfoacetaldehyde dehydrogenase [Arenicella sp.]